MKAANFLFCALLLMSLTACSIFKPDNSPAIIVPTDANPDAPPLYLETTRVDEVGRIVVPVMVNEQGPFYFMLDTGASNTVIAHDLAQTLGLTTKDLPPTAVRGVTGVTLAPTTRITSLRAGELHFNDLRVAILLGPIMDGLDGILGVEGLTDKKITADLANDQITIAASMGAPAGAHHVVIPFELLPSRAIVVAAKVGKVPVKAVIDTGGVHTLGNRALLDAVNAANRRDRQRQWYGLPTRVIDVTDSEHAALLMRVPRIALGEAAVVNLPVTFSEFQIFKLWGLQNQPALLIGMDVLGLLGELTIDYGRKEIHLR
ncbi:MAG: retropepsin-like aspartic protease [Steroidobacteraceae bacterium]